MWCPPHNFSSRTILLSEYGVWGAAPWLRKALGLFSHYPNYGGMGACPHVYPLPLTLLLRLWLKGSAANLLGKLLGAFLKKSTALVAVANGNAGSIFFEQNQRACGGLLGHFKKRQRA